MIDCTTQKSVIVIKGKWRRLVEDDDDEQTNTAHRTTSKH